MTITEHELQQCEKANVTGRPPVVFVHGFVVAAQQLGSVGGVVRGERLRHVDAGMAGRPGDGRGGQGPSRGVRRQDDRPGRRSRRGDNPRAHQEAGNHRAFLRWLADPDLAGRGLAAASVAIDPAPFRGVLPLPISSLKSALPVLGDPANRNRAVPLTYEQFRYGFANAVSEDEAKELYETYAVPTSGKPLFQAATANLNPWTDAKVDTENPARGPLLIISGDKDHTVPPAIANASYKQQRDNEGVTEIVEMKNRGHALPIDSGWRQVAETALTFVKRFV